MELNNKSFGQAIKLIHNYLNLPYKYTKNQENKPKDNDFLNIFKRVKRTKCIVNTEETLYDDSILKEYSDLPYLDWVKEGILPVTCKKFNIGYSFDKKRIIIPWRHWCGESDKKYVGVVGRTTIKGYELLNVPKYLCIQPFTKGNNVYGLYENYEEIQRKGYVVVYESEKSVLKRYSYKDGTGVAIGCHTLTSEQVKILIGLNVDIVIAFDKDVPINDVRKECEKFYKIRNVYYLNDKWGIMNDKESPADKQNKAFEFMFKYKIPYNNKEHNLLKR